MTQTLLPSTHQIVDVFSWEVAERGGQVTDRFNKAGSLYLRAVLPEIRDIRPRDAVQSGVCLMTTGPKVHVAPYTFREVCRNGAIHAETVCVRSAFRVDAGSSPDIVDLTVDEIAELVREYSDPAVFNQVARQMKAAAATPIDLALQVIPYLQNVGGPVILGILRNLEESGDRTHYGLMNAITARARVERDPQTRWDLEELGGAVPAFRLPVESPDGALAEPLVGV